MRNFIVFFLLFGVMLVGFACSSSNKEAADSNVVNDSAVTSDGDQVNTDNITSDSITTDSDTTVPADSDTALTDNETNDDSAAVCDISKPEYTIGTRLCKTGVEGGYVLFPHKHRGEVYLIDRLGRLVHKWSKSKYEPGQSCYLRDNGNLVRAAMIKSASGSIGGGEGGRIEEYDWDDNLVWAFDYSSNEYSTHHDFKIMPNGNLLMLVVERKDSAAAGAAGFDTTKLQDGYVAPEKVIEVQKTGTDSYKVVWEWHVWDHLIQNTDSKLANYGNLAENPGRLAVAGGAPAFWNHANSIDYNAELDQIVISARSHNEFWVLDHTTTTAEAATRSGGKYGKGGDFIYRWGNPQMYGSGTSADRMLYNQHDAQWIKPGLPGEGNFLVFNNGLDRPGGNYSSLDELVSPVLSDGNYPAITSGTAWGPKTLSWQFKSDPTSAFYSSEISGVQRLPNGNTLACEGVNARFFEVTSDGKMVWEYINPVDNAGPMAQYEYASLDPKTHPESAVFKIHWYPANFSGFTGKDLTPGNVIERDDKTCQIDNPSYTCKQSADCKTAGGEDVSTHFSCSSGGICCFKLIENTAKPPR